MTKKRSKNHFIVFAILLVLLLVASFVNFTYPFAINGNYYSYSSFISNLALGQDVGRSVRILYRASGRDNESNYEELRQSTINQLLDITKVYGYYDTTATPYGEDGILVQVGNILNKEDGDNIIDLIGNPVDISFSIDKSEADAEKFATAKDVESVSMQEGANGSKTVYYITITFKDPKTIYEKIKEGKTLYAFLGDQNIVSLTLSSGLENFESSGQITFSNSGISDRTTANKYVNMIRTGLLDLQLTAPECNKVSPSLGTWATISVAVISAIVVLAMFVFLIVKYKQIGWIACFNLLFFITIGLFIMQSIPILHINFAGIVAMLVAFILVSDMHILIFEKAKQHYADDTQLYIAFNMSIKETWMRILITLSLLFVSGLISVFMPTLAIKSFGWAMMILSLVGALTVLAMMRLFVKMYLSFNASKGEKCNFHKGGKNA